MRLSSVARHHRRGQRGTSAILMVIFMSALLGMGALGTDVARLYSERRLDQNSVDAAAMSALIATAVAGGDLQVAVDEVLEKIDTDLDRTVPTADWTACSDSNALEHTAAELNLVPQTQCISFSASFDSIRVQVPSQTVDGVFGSAIGFDNYASSAAATVRLEGGGSGAPPFVALSTAQKGDFICLRTGGAQSSEPLTLMDGNGPGVPATPGIKKDPCDDSVYATDSANFGTILPHAYTDGCRQRETEKEVAISIGIDHPLGFYPNGYTAGDPERLDGANNCQTAFPNTLEIDTGFSAQGLRCAILSLRNGPNADSCNNEYPRLWQGQHFQSTYKVSNEPMDNTPAWTFLRDKYDLANDGAPQSCIDLATNRDNESTWEFYDKHDALFACFNDWQSGDPVIFIEDLAESARFAFIPQVAEAALVGSKVHIVGFVPVFLTRLYISTSNAPMCDSYDTRTTNWLVHDAGQQISCGDKNQNLDKLSSTVLACGMLPSSMCSRERDLPVGAGIDVYNFLLVE